MVPAFLRPRTFGTVALALVCLVISACSGTDPDTNAGERSPEQYCEAFYSRASPLRQEYLDLEEQSQGDPLAGLLPALGAPGRLAVVFDGMVPHAPDDIRAETEAVRDALQDLQDSLGGGASDPAGMALKNLLIAASSSSSFEAVGAYLDEYCPVGSPIAARYGATSAPSNSSSPGTGTRPSGTRTPDDKAPPVGTQLVSVSGAGGYDVITNGNGFAIVRNLVAFSTGVDSSTVTTYDAAGNELASISAGSLTGDCAAADVRTAGGDRILLTQKVTSTPAAGINPATDTVTLDAWDAVTGDSLWSTTIVPPTENWMGCDIYSGSQGVLDRFAFTEDGRWGVYQGGPTDDETNIVRSQVIDLSSGDVTYAGELMMRVLGNYLASGNEGSFDDQPVTIHDPATAQQVGQITGLNLGEGPFAASNGLFNLQGADTGLTTDARRLLAMYDPTEPNASGADRARKLEIAAYNLPSGDMAWRSPHLGGAMAPIATGGGTVIASDGADNLVGLDEKTGQHRWRLPYGEVCGVTDTQFMLLVNNQLAVIDIMSGTQVSFTAEANCPNLKPGGISVMMGSIAPGEPHGLTVTQILTP